MYVLTARRNPLHAVCGKPAANRTVTLTGPGTHMTSIGVENLEFDAEQRQRSAQVLPKLPPASERTPKTPQNAGQEAGLVADNDGQIGFGAIMLHKMADDGRRPDPTGKYRLGGLNRAIPNVVQAANSLINSCVINLVILAL